MGNIGEAIESLTDGLRIAETIGDAQQMSATMSFLAGIYAGGGHIEEAERLLEHAQELATATGSVLFEAEVRDRRAHLARTIGQTAHAIPHLREAVRLMERTGNSDGLASVRIDLAEALTHANQWQEAAPILRSIAEAPSDAVRPNIRAASLRYLAVLYSRRNLAAEALVAGRDAVELAEQCGDTVEQMHCRLTLGNVFARMDRWAEAIAEYELAIPIAARKQQLQELLTAHSNRATCRYKLGDTTQAMRDVRTSIALASKLGLIELEASLYLNLASYLTDSGKTDESIESSTQARLLAERLDNSNLAAAATMNLARAHWDKGDNESAHTLARDARTCLQTTGDWTASAAALAMELRTRFDLSEQLDMSGAMEYLRAPETEIANQVVAAFWARPEFGQTGFEALAGAPSDSGRNIHIADDVKDHLEGIDLNALTSKLSRARRNCLICRLPIAEHGLAELIVVRYSETTPPAVSLAHATCIPSGVIRMEGRVPELESIHMEAECAILGDGTAAIIVDCRGGEVYADDGLPHDIFLETLCKAGFAKVSHIRTAEPVSSAALQIRESSSNLSAKLVGDQLTLLVKGEPLLSDFGLSFLPKWYNVARSGVLLALFGRNLHGMVYDNPEYVIRAANDGSLVAAALELDITAPSRNGRCVCTPRTGLKYKKCCGRARTEAGSH